MPLARGRRVLDKHMIFEGVHDALLRGNTKYQREIHSAIGNYLAASKVQGLHLVRVEMPCGRIHHHVGNVRVFTRKNGLSAHVLIDIADDEILEVIVVPGQFRVIDRHDAFPGLRNLTRFARLKPTMRLSSLSNPSVRHATMPLPGLLLESRFSTVSVLATTVIPG